MLRVAICDDDHITCGQIENFIIKYAASSSTNIQIETYFAGEELLQDFRKEYFDLVFLDIELGGGLNGIEVARVIRDDLGLSFVNIVFISSHIDYALASFDVYPMHYIVKPISEHKIIELIERTKEFLGILDTTFTYRSSNEERKIPLKKILYFQSQGPIIYIHTSEEESGGILSYYGTLKGTHKTLTETGGMFIHCHRSYIVNYCHILKRRHDYFELTNGERIPISEYKKESAKVQYSLYGKRSI